MTTNTILRKHVEDALLWAAGIDESRIAVVAEDGLVTLTGHVPSYYQRTEAERAVVHVYGVKGLTNDLEIDLPGDSHRTDAEIEESATVALGNWVMVPRGNVQVTVHNGWVTLTGKLDSQYQRGAAYNAVRYLYGVKRVANEIEITSAVTPINVKERIEAAFVRHAHLDASKIRVEMKDHMVTLRGTVSSLVERNAAASAAWAAPGVWNVEDDLVVEI